MSKQSLLPAVLFVSLALACNDAAPVEVHVAALDGDPDDPHALSAPGTLSALTSVAGEPTTPRFVQVTVPAGHDGLRIAVRAAGNVDVIVHRDGATGGALAADYDKPVHTFFFAPDEVTADDQWWVEVVPDEDTTFDVQVDTVYAHPLDWDDGSDLVGVDAFDRPTNTFGDYLFSVTTQLPQYGIWRNVLRVGGGEADLWLAYDALPQSYNQVSQEPGSDSYPLSTNEFADNQIWYLRVHATTGDADWQVVSGDIHVEDLGPLANAATPRTLDLDVGLAYFTTEATAQTLAWRLEAWGGAIYVDDTQAPLVRPGQVIADHEYTDEALIVPPYLQAQSYLVAIKGSGPSIEVDSRNHLVRDPQSVPGATGGAFDFTLSQADDDGFGYRTYRVVVPVQQIAWEVRAKPLTGDIDLYVKRATVPSEWNNDAMSEVVGVTDAVSLVPDSLTNDTFYVTVRGKAPFSFELRSRNPVIPTIPFITAPYVQNDAGYAAQVGWRYYQVENAPPPLGTLGWILELENHVPGTAIAVRRNRVPSRWDYRSQGQPGTVEHYDQMSTLGFLERPNHPTDVWYIGIYQPSSPLGTFRLRTRAMTATELDFDGGVADVTQASGRLRYFRVEVPDTADGWDLRLENAVGRPRLVARAELLPEGFNDSTHPYPFGWYEGWDTGEQWAPLNELTHRPATYVDESTSPIDESGHFLLGGKGNPIRAGFFYVLASDAWTEASAGETVSYRIHSTGIGPDLTHEITPLQFNNGVATASNLAPREIRYFRVDVPVGAKSWYLELEPTVGDAMLAIKKGSVPNLEAGYPNTDLSVPGARRQRGGYELFYRYPETTTTELTPGSWYIAVGAEGDAPPNTGYVVGGTTSFKLTSHGEAPVTQRTLVLDAPTTITNQALRFGEQHTYQVIAPAGTTSLEARLVDKTGNPLMHIVRGPVQAVPQQSYGASEGGEYPLDTDDEVLSIAAGANTYSITIVANADGSNLDADATFDLEITARSESTFVFNGGTKSVTQAFGVWTYFRVEVPDTALGWYLNLANVTGGNPYMVVRKTDPPDTVQSTYAIQYATAMNDGDQIAPGTELTGRYADAVDIDGNYVAHYGQYMSLGMGSPLSPGTYWVGVIDNASASGQYSYTIVSRGIGDVAGTDPEGNPWLVPVYDLGFNATDTRTRAPREHAYYRVTVPDDAKSWELRLTNVSGEAMMMVEKGVIANGDEYYNGGAWYRKKEGRELAYRYPDASDTPIPGGVYYVGVGAEGQDPHPNGISVGTGTSTFTIESRGELEVAEAPAPITTTPYVFEDQQMVFGENKVYRFTVNPGAPAVEARFLAVSGNPHMVVVAGDEIPAPWQSEYGTAVGGVYSGVEDETAVTVAVPSGTYTVIVSAQGTPTDGENDAAFDLQLKVVDPTLAFNGGEVQVDAQPANTWRYFTVEVPAGALGWDLRLLDTVGSPRIVIRRDSVPNDYNTSYLMQYAGDWPSDTQWAPGGELTQRYEAPYDPQSTAGTTYGQAVSMGMGSPLEPGTYYVGINNGTTQLPAMSYRIVSRGIGIGNDGNALPWRIQVADLPFGTEVTATNLAPREHRYYRVQVPEGMESWGAELTPTLGEAMLAVRKDHLPNAEAGYGYPWIASDQDGLLSGARRQKPGREYLYKFPRYTTEDERTARGGTYYFAVGAEGQNPAQQPYIGTGPTSFKLRTYGPVPIVGGLDRIIETAPYSFTGQVSAYGETKLYRFRVPDTVKAFEVRLANRVGDPQFSVSVEPSLAARIPYANTQTYYATEDGDSPTATGELAEDIVGLTGDVTIAVFANDPDSESRYDLIITPKAVRPLAWSGGDEDVTLKDREFAYFEVDVPQDCDGVAQAGWIVSQDSPQGEVEVFARPETLPGDPVGDVTLVTSANETIIVPPYLRPGKWFIAVRGKGSAQATITTREVVEARHWDMPAAGQTANTPGLTHPLFADTGVDDDGHAIINEGSGDQGTDLGEGRFIFYRLTVPENNGGLFRTKLEAISGNPQLYIRRGAAPAINNMPHPYNQNIVDYRDEREGSTYGHWVAPDTRYGVRLAPGEYWLGVYAQTTNVRFRLRVDLGDIQTLDFGAVSNQQVLAGDMRYFKVTLPDTTTTAGQGMPRDWTIRFTQTLGDGVVFLREGVPPGLTQDVPDPTTVETSYHYLADWNDDRYPSVYELPSLPKIEDTNTGTPLVLSTPVLRPNTTYWLGVFARTDVTFNLSTSASATKTTVAQILPYAGSAIDASIPANSQRLYKITVPSDAALYKHVANIPDGVELYLSAGMIPPTTASADWSYNGSSDPTYASHQAALYGHPYYQFNHPWVPGAGYYLIVKNTNGSAANVHIDFEGRAYTADFDGDEIDDGWEYRYFNTLDFDLDSDADYDLLSNREEFIEGTNPQSADTDGDDLGDGLELIAGGDPLLPDTDSDQVCDGSDSAPDDAGEAGPVIRLYMHEYEGGTYGNNHGTNEHKTRLVAVFKTYGEVDTHWIHAQGFDIESADEVALTLNGKPLGYLGVSGNGASGLPQMWVVRNEDLLPNGFDNRLELRRKSGGDGDWGVSALGLMTFGHTFGGDPTRAFDHRHPAGFDLTFVDGLDDALIELRGFDLESAGDVRVAVNDTPYLSGLEATANETWTPPLQVPFVAADQGAGPHVWKVRPHGDAAWQLRIVTRRPLLSTFGSQGTAGDDNHFSDAFHFLYPVKPALRELVLRYLVYEGTTVAVADTNRGPTTYEPDGSNSWSANQPYFSVAAVQDRVTARKVVVTGDGTFGVQLVYYGPCADVDGSGLDDCEEICDDGDGDGVDGLSEFCPAGTDCDDDDPDVGASNDDGDCDGVPTASDCNDQNASMPIGDADCDGVATASDCNDADATKPSNDLDCDGVVNASDCAPTDPTKPSNDHDCDGTVTASDCNDNNASQPSNDRDCDGAATAVDCDDNNAQVQTCPTTCVDADNDGHDKQAADCAGGDDCNDGSATSTYLGVDADCDGVQTGVDCNDSSAADVRVNTGDADCDGIPTAVDCNDNSAAVTATNVGDADCDGVATAIDCNDASAAVKTTNVGDADCDGVGAAIDCNDASAAIKNVRTNDADCDAVPTATDCNDNDVNVRNVNTNDADCDLVNRTIDCNDNDATNTRSRVGDNDCDGVPATLDCNDNNLAITHTRTGDADCDLVPTATDCNDNNANVTNTRTNDADCDGVASDIDCNDNSAAVKTTNVGDADCDGVGVAIDCDDTDGSVRATNVGDADCDGVGVATDCDDGDASVTTTNVGDADCDGVRVAIDCDDGDASVTTTNVGDADCDGVGVAVDCDDRDASITTTKEGDQDCDGVGTAVDCNDHDAAITTTNGGDKDCDGVATALDCDDADAANRDVREANDGDCDGVSDPLDCGPADRDDARSRAGDNDCDGVPSERDCDDRDPANDRLNTNDRDCDGVPSAVDCDDLDSSLTTTSAGDKDCDGRATATDCDDTDRTVQDCPLCDDGDNDGHGGRSESCPKGDDCDDADPESTWRAVDGDCDGVRSEDDCDDGDADSTVIADDGDCDEVATAADCDDADEALGAREDDPDCDAVVVEDNCPEHANPDQKDSDFNGVGDVCEPCALGDDSDGDGYVDACDVCPGVDDDQRDRDDDGIGDACDDSDDDGVLDGDDNCPERANADQADSDRDAIGDACDTLDVTTTSEDSGCHGGALGYGVLSLLAVVLARGRRTASR